MKLYISEIIILNCEWGHFRVYCSIVSPLWRSFLVVEARASDQTQFLGSIVTSVHLPIAPQARKMEPEAITGQKQHKKRNSQNANNL